MNRPELTDHAQAAVLELAAEASTRPRRTIEREIMEEIGVDAATAAKIRNDAEELHADPLDFARSVDKMVRHHHDASVLHTC